MIEHWPMANSGAWIFPSANALAVFILASILCFIIYQVYFHPLSKVPGPKLAAITTLYEGWIDVNTQGRFLWKIEEWHQRYGNIVRIGPNEVHINDPSYYKTLYDGKLDLDKFEYYYKLMIFPSTTFGSISAKVHQTRRTALDPYFSSRAVTKVQSSLQQLVDRLCERMHERIAENEPIPLFYAYRSLTVDLISEYVLGKRFDILEREDWGKSFYHAFRCVMEVTPLMRQFPFLLGIFMAMPRWMVGLIDNRMLEIIDLNSAVDVATTQSLRSSSATTDLTDHPNVVSQLANSRALPQEEKELDRIRLEANSIVTGGMEATSATLTYTTFQILNNFEIHARLNEELQQAISDPDRIPHHSKLQELPYLTACIKEGLRLSFSAIGRLSRCSRDGPIQYDGHIIPEGSGIGMSSYFIHLNAEIFPSPHAYDPSRWLAKEADLTLEPYLVPFSRGSRTCIGKHLAYAELYTVLATVLRRFPTLELFETSKRDVELVHDYFAGVSRHEHDGLQVRLKPSEGN